MVVEVRFSCTGFVSIVAQSEMKKMKKTQHVQAVYIRKMQALPGKVGGLTGDIVVVMKR